MMQHQRLEGVEVVLQRFDRITDAARDQLGVELAIMGRDFRERQRADAPSLTGALRAALSVWLMLDQLKVRVGLIGQRNARSRKRSYGDAFYGRFVQFGRKAQTVIVQRRKRVVVNVGDGEQKAILRKARGRKIAADIASTYSMKVKARAPHPFIFVPSAQQDATERLVSFWDQTLAKAGA